VLRFVHTNGDFMDVFTARELRNHSGELLNDAELGKLSLITKHGKPAFLAVPFDEKMLAIGIDKVLALKFFEQGDLTMSQSAKLAGLDLYDFMDLLGNSGIPAVNYPAKELRDEMEYDL